MGTGSTSNHNRDRTHEINVAGVPDIDEIQLLAKKLHAAGASFEGEAWNWPVNYDPELPEPPLDSRLTFTPASFWIGVWPIWYVSITWEHGHTQEPNIFIGQENLVHQSVMLRAA